MTTPAESFLPLTRAIYAVLCDGAGTARKIPAAERFKRATSPARAQAVKARGLGRLCYVEILKQEPPSDGYVENYSPQLVDIEIRILTWHYAGLEMVTKQAEDAASVASNDAQHIRGAVCYPGNVATDPDSEPTGVVTAIKWRGASGPTPDPDERVIERTHLFETKLLWTMRP